MSLPVSPHAVPALPDGATSDHAHGPQTRGGTLSELLERILVASNSLVAVEAPPTTRPSCGHLASWVSREQSALAQEIAASSRLLERNATALVEEVSRFTRQLAPLGR